MKMMIIECTQHDYFKQLKILQLKDFLQHENFPQHEDFQQQEDF